MFSKPPARAQQLATEIEQSIVQRGLQTGERIANMEELREATGYGRATIGETARLLAERGTVEIRPGRGGGLFVASISPVVRLRRTLLTVTDGQSTVSDAIAVREALEELIALDAARHHTPEDVVDLRRCMQSMADHGDDWSAFMAANWTLHERIAAVTPNELARAVYVGTIRCVAELTVHAQTEEKEDAEEYLASRVAVHTQLVEAIISGDLDRTRDAVEAHRGISVGADMVEEAPDRPSSPDAALVP
ncbi:DNA-binding transcriptional regulator, FadR family [Nocardioides alpinus]|uniref:DNA-binding transcriptional regulator, FadR family n=1 Tax=Nocardioides alpinus TaxID=748909 RepID=A0A1I0YAF6_9ACTN|nr:FCD domain-containing protein [Nocardioides alpinus]PKH38993.1 FadR family transcriptional regulator [Nocardioides alpinus]SFB09490.1 DNA-binding transcriptional regulator, FadR family [Nocardioides alpinus]